MICGVDMEFKFTEPKSDLTRARELKNALNKRNQKELENLKKPYYKLFRWVRHPINSFKRWLVLSFPKHFNLGE